MDLCSRSSTIASCGMINSGSEKPAALTGGNAERVLWMTCPSKRRTAGQAAAPRGVRTNPGMISFAHANMSIDSRFVWREREIPSHLVGYILQFHSRVLATGDIRYLVLHTRPEGGRCVRTTQSCDLLYLVQPKIHHLDRHTIRHHRELIAHVDCSLSI